MGKKAFKSEDPPGVGAWMVSFSDCMTNLLTFFVLLCSFSSFDEESLQRLSGVFDSMSVYSVFPSQHKRSEGIIEPLDHLVDVTAEGSEAPTLHEPDVTVRPKQVGWIDDQSAYSDRRVLVVPSAALFAGRGSQLSDEGKTMLDLLADFLRLLPCHVVVNECVPPGQDASEGLSLDRSWGVMSYLGQRAELSSSAFSIAAVQVSTNPRHADGPVIRITLLKRSFYR